MNVYESMIEWLPFIARYSYSQNRDGYSQTSHKHQPLYSAHTNKVFPLTLLVRSNGSFYIYIHTHTYINPNLISLFDYFNTLYKNTYMLLKLFSIIFHNNSTN